MLYRHSGALWQHRDGLPFDIQTPELFQQTEMYNVQTRPLIRHDESAGPVCDYRFRLSFHSLRISILRANHRSRHRIVIALDCRSRTCRPDDIPLSCGVFLGDSSRLPTLLSHVPKTQNHEGHTHNNKAGCDGRADNPSVESRKFCLDVLQSMERV